jgi:hypothetical protein
VHPQDLWLSIPLSNKLVTRPQSSNFIRDEITARAGSATTQKEAESELGKTAYFTNQEHANGIPPTRSKNQASLEIVPEAESIASPFDPFTHCKFQGCQRIFTARHMYKYEPPLNIHLFANTNFSQPPQKIALASRALSPLRTRFRDEKRSQATSQRYTRNNEEVLLFCFRFASMQIGE